MVSFFDVLEMDLDEAEMFYQRLRQPSNLVRGMSEEDFEGWLDLAEDLESLEAALKAFEEDEMFEYCIIIKNRIDQWEKKKQTKNRKINKGFEK